MISRCSIIGFGSMGKKHAKNAREGFYHGTAEMA